MVSNEGDIERLIGGCLRNDRKAQQQLYDNFYAAMIRICMRYTKNEADAMDVLQDAFLKVFRNIGRYDPRKGALATWIRTIVIRAAIDFISSRKVTFSQVTESDPGQPIENPILEKFNAQELLGLIRELPDSSQLVFNLYVIEGFSHKEIARALGISDGTSRWHLNEARRLLRASIRRMEGTANE